MFKVLAILNRVILPSMIGKDLTKLNSFQKLIIAFRYWVTKNSL